VLKRAKESGQAFPAYIAVIAGLMFLALVYVVVGQAAIKRSDAQTAADAAALAAAQDAREQLRQRWLEVALDPARWGPFLRGEEYDVGPACERAALLAAHNEAELWGERCDRLETEGEGFRVTVRTTESIGESLVPDTESRHATATAEAVIKPLCTFEALEPTPVPPEQVPSPSPSHTAPEEGDADVEEPPIEGLRCRDDAWEIDPEAPTLPEASDLFAVHLIH
jgi:hypothetical protein